VWKSIQIDNYPIKFEKTTNNNPRTMRNGTTRDLKEIGNSKIAKKRFYTTSARLWNHAPEEIKEAKTLNRANLWTS
jgi:hypothetical protein